MATREAILGRKRRTGFTTEEWKAHGWWIEGERGDTAAPRHQAHVFIGKEPLGTKITPGLEFCAGTVLAISIGSSGQPHFFVTTQSVADAKTEVTYTLQCSNILRPISRLSKASDVLQNLDQAAQWWDELSVEEKRRRELISKQGSETPIGLHNEVEQMFATARVSLWRFSHSKVSTLETSFGHPVNLPFQNEEEDDGEAYKVYSAPLRKGPIVKKFTVLPSDTGGCLDGESERTRIAASVAEEMEFEETDLVFDAVHRSKRKRQIPSSSTLVERNPKVYFGSSLKPKLKEGCVFGSEYTFAVEVAKVAEPSNPCTNHRMLNEDNATRLYEMICGGKAMKNQMPPMILRPKTYIGLDGRQVEFLLEGDKQVFENLHNAHIRAHGRGIAARESFLSCFTWEPVDGQHIRAACVEIALQRMQNGSMTEAQYNELFSKWSAQVVLYDEPQLFIELSRQVNNDRVARCPTIALGQSLATIQETWMYFGRVGPSSQNDTQAIVDARARFFSTLHAATGIPPVKEDSTLSELRTKFEVYLRFTCMEDKSAFQAVLRMCDHFELGLTQYGKAARQKGSSKLAITWLRPLRALTDSDIHLFAQKCSYMNGEQQWYFEDFEALVANRKQGYAILNAMRWMLKDEHLGRYTYQALMQVHVVKKYNIPPMEIKELSADARTSFVQKWKGPACEDFKKQKQYESLIPKSIKRFMEYKLKGIPTPTNQPQWIAKSRVKSDVHKRRESHVQVSKSILEASIDKLNEKCIWMVDCRFAAANGSGISISDVPVLLEQIMKWMTTVTRWNAVIMLGPNQSASDIQESLFGTAGFEDIVLQEGSYTFSRQSSNLQKSIRHGAHKLYFRVSRGLLYVMQYPRESDWRPNAILESDAEWPTSWTEPTKRWDSSEWNAHARCPRTVMSIMQHSAPEDWMVALVGLTHMVLSLVDCGVHRITVFEGEENIRSKIQSWMESKQENVIAPKRRTRANARDASPSEKSDAGSEGNLVDDISFDAQREEAQVKGRPHEGTPEAVAGTNENVDSNAAGTVTDTEAIVDVRGHVVENRSVGTSDRDGPQHNGREDVVTPIVQNNFGMQSVSPTNGTAMATGEAESVVGLGELGSSSGAGSESVQSISALKYEREGDFYSDRLERMWIQEDPVGPICALESDRWGTFNGKYFKMIELADLTTRLAQGSEVEKESSSKALDDAASFLMFIASGLNAGASDACANLERVLETPPK